MSIRPGRGLLFVATQGLGDVVQTLPLLRSICELAQNHWPVYLLLASSRQFELLHGENLPLFRIFVHDGPKNRRSPVKLWRKLAGKVDLIVSAPEISAAKLMLLRYAIGARYVFGETSPFLARFLTHSVQQSWTMPWSSAVDEIAVALGVRVPLPPPHIHLSTTEIEYANGALMQAGFNASRFIVGVQCSSVVPEKRWPAEKFGELLRRLRNRFAGLHVISFGSDDERADAQQARRHSEDVPWLEGAGKWNLRETMAMLSRCDLFISGDTGLMHIAAALDVLTLSVFGPTSALRRAPRHNRGIAVSPQTPCYPCFRGRWNGCQCIRSISPQTVFEAAVRLVGSPNEQREFSVLDHAESCEALNR